MRPGSAVATRLTGHVELFHVDTDSGVRTLAHTSRPCAVCGHPLLDLVVPLREAKSMATVHSTCRGKVGGLRPPRRFGQGRPRAQKLLSLMEDLVVIKRLMGGAENFMDEGLTYIQNIFPRQTQALPASTYLGLFTAQSASTVPNPTLLLGGSPPIANITEPTAATGGYARAQVTNASWGAPSVTGGGSGVETVSSQISFAQSTGSGFSPSSQNGFFLTQQLAQGAGSIGIAFANFSDVTAINVNAAGYVIQLTPTYHFDV